MTAVLGQAGPVQDTVFPLTVQLRQLDPDIDAPSYAKPGDAGADLRTTQDVVLQPGERRMVPTGIAIALPLGYVGLIHPRSGLAAKHGLTVVNTPGTVDAGYRGEIQVCLLNTDKEHPIVLARGDRIAQLVIQRVETAVFEIVDELPESERGEGGFGSTGGFNAQMGRLAASEDYVLERAGRLAFAVRAVAPETGDRSVEVLCAAFILALATPGVNTDDEAEILGIAQRWLGDDYVLNMGIRTPTVGALPAAEAAFKALHGPGSREEALLVPRNRLHQIATEPSAFKAWSEQVLSV